MVTTQKSPLAMKEEVLGFITPMPAQSLTQGESDMPVGSVRHKAKTERERAEREAKIDNFLAKLKRQLLQQNTDIDTLIAELLVISSARS